MLAFGTWTVIVSKVNESGVKTDLFLNDQDPSDVGDIDRTDVVRIIDKVWLRRSVNDVAVWRQQQHTDHIRLSAHLCAVRSCQNEVASHETLSSGGLNDGKHGSDIQRIRN